VGTAYYGEEDLLILRCYMSKRSRERVQLARTLATHDHKESLEPQAVAMDVDDPRELIDAECATSTSELGGETVILEEDACRGVDQASEVLWHARMGHLNRRNLRVVLRQTVVKSINLRRLSHIQIRKSIMQVYRLRLISTFNYDPMCCVYLYCLPFEGRARPGQSVSGSCEDKTTSYINLRIR